MSRKHASTVEEELLGASDAERRGEKAAHHAANGKAGHGSRRRHRVHLMV
jgi:hypothetical protein